MSEIARLGEAVTIIDTDSNAPFVRFAEIGNLPPNVTVIEDKDTTGKDLAKTVKSLREESGFVLVDTEGSENMRTGIAVQLADLAIIPCQWSKLDEVEALKLLEFVEVVNEGREKQVPAIVVPTNVDAAIATNLSKRIKANIQQSGGQIVDPPLLRKEIFKLMFEQGRLLHDTDYEAKPSSLEAARENAESVCLAIARHRSE
jgi:cellulose biosynthesis protein BcsQ